MYNLGEERQIDDGKRDLILVLEGKLLLTITEEQWKTVTDSYEVAQKFFRVFIASLIDNKNIKQALALRDIVDAYMKDNGGVEGLFKVTQEVIKNKR